MDSSSTSRAAISTSPSPLLWRSRSSTFWPDGTATRLSIQTGARSLVHLTRAPSREDDTMAKAVRVHQPGGPEALVYEEIEVAAAGAGEVRIRQHASGL